MLDGKAVTEWIAARSIKGFLAEDEGEALFELALEASKKGPCLEIGSYCGKSTLYLAAACAKNESIVFALDHHAGSEEHQLGEEYHDPDLYDQHNLCMNSFPEFRKNIRSANLDPAVIPVVSSSKKTVSVWETPLAMVFVDGGHSPQMAMDDCVSWSKKIMVGGILAVHDIFEHPEEGGQGPYLALQAVLDSGDFKLEGKVNSMGVARRIR